MAEQRYPHHGYYHPQPPDYHRQQEEGWMAVVNRSLHNGGSVSYGTEAGTSAGGNMAAFASPTNCFGEHTGEPVQQGQDSDFYFLSHSGSESDKRKRKAAKSKQNRIKKKQEEAALEVELSHILDEQRSLENEKKRVNNSIQQLSKVQEGLYPYYNQHEAPFLCQGSFSSMT